MNVNSEDQQSSLIRALGPVDATMIVMGGVIGSGIFVSPSVVAREVHSAGLILCEWLIGGVLALLGACGLAGYAALQAQAQAVRTAPAPRIDPRTVRTRLPLI